MMTSCATVPDADSVIDQAAATGTKPRIMGTHGPLTAKQSEALLKKISTDGKVSDALQRHLAIEQAVAETPLVTGNRTRLLHDGPETFKAIFEAARAAKNHINLEYYIVEDVQYDGEHLSDLLIRKQREGVKVNLIYDSIGSLETPPEFFDNLKKAGIKVVQFNPVNPLKAKGKYSINDRDHRKIFIVDGRTAIVGGINLSKTYQSSPFEGEGGHGSGADAKNAANRKPDNANAGNPQAGTNNQQPQNNERWRDTDMQIDGPVVAQLQNLFVEHWRQQKGPALDDANFFPKVEPQGAEVARVIGSSPDSAAALRFYVTLVSAMRNAEKSIALTAAYFVPTDEEREALIDAARRGVDVRILLPSHSDAKSALMLQHAHYTGLLEAGVKIYELQNLMLHSKTAVVDGVWSVIGSSNFDYRSVLFNDEVDVVVLGSATASDVAAMFEDDLKRAKQINLAEWRKRPLWERIQENSIRIIKKLF